MTSYAFVYAVGLNRMSSTRHARGRKSPPRVNRCGTYQVLACTSTVCWPGAQVHLGECARYSTVFSKFTDTYCFPSTPTVSTRLAHVREVYQSLQYEGLFATLQHRRRAEPAAGPAVVPEINMVEIAAVCGYSSRLAARCCKARFTTPLAYSRRWGYRERRRPPRERALPPASA